MHRILIIDDHEFVLESLKYGLEDDFIVKTSNNSKLGIEKAKDFQPDVVMVDFRMEGLNGLQVTEQLMNNPRPPAIIMFSACMDDRLEKQAMDKGAIDCMTKPFDLFELRAKLQKLTEDKDFDETLN